MFLVPAKPLDPNEKSFAKHWEFNALKYQPYFEIKKIQAQANLNHIRNSAFVFGDAIKRRNRFSQVDSLYLR